ncbi:MAG: hypothetical protein H6867_09400 [Rhodospirillales bacterium]|nr:hypothetical protein [Rhodospirillales bacterium]
MRYALGRLRFLQQGYWSGGGVLQDPFQLVPNQLNLHFGNGFARFGEEQRELLFCRLEVIVFALFHVIVKRVPDMLLHGGGQNGVTIVCADINLMQIVGEPVAKLFRQARLRGFQFSRQKGLKLLFLEDWF